MNQKKRQLTNVNKKIVSLETAIRQLINIRVWTTKNQPGLSKKGFNKQIKDIEKLLRKLRFIRQAAKIEYTQLLNRK